MQEVSYYNKSIQESIKSLDSKKDGLSKAEAQKRLEEYGKNTIKRKRKFRLLKNLVSQFNSFLIYILMIAAAISFFIGHNLDGFVISAIVLLNATIGFFQQNKAENTIQKLKKLIVPRVAVMREGKRIEISSEELVPGDIMLLEAGDKISADARVIEEENSGVNEAALTGESLSVSKQSSVIKKDVSLADMKNMVFTGTQLVKGTIKALVVNTGANTVFGKIAENLQDIEEVKTPVEKRLDKFSKQIGLIILGIVGLLMILGFIGHLDLIEMFLTSVALAVSAIPEGLPAVLTLSFAISSLVMSKKNVVIRKLPAVESLGSVTTICTDKTGTLTEEKMTIEEFFANNQLYEKENENLLREDKKISLKKHEELKKLIETSVLCNNARFEEESGKYKYYGDPTETALVEAAMDVGINKKELIDSQKSLQKIEFDSDRKMMTVLRKKDQKQIAYIKGASVKILEKSTHELINGNVRKLTKKRKEELRQRSIEMEDKALRVLAFAYKQVKRNEKLNEDDLIFIGFGGMIDPPRKEIKGAIKECKSAGIKVKIITGDSPITAKAIGEKIGITGRVVAEEELRNMSDLELIKSIDEISIFARVTPEQKLRITKILQKKNETVAITGDGVNDSLALKSADVGIAMGKRGSDVSRDVADIVLIDDNFASIVEGIKQGRTTYDNIKKFTKYLLSVNFAEIFLVLFALLLGMPLPLTALQILWINLVSDSFPSLSLAFEKGHDVMKSKPRKEKSILHGIWLFIIVAGILTFIAKLSVYLIGTSSNYSIELIRTMVLSAAVSYELLFVYTCRSKKSLFEIGVFSNKWLNLAVLFSFGLHMVLLYTPLGNFFDLVPLTLNNWLLIAPIAFSGLIIFEAAKLIRNKKAPKRKSK